MATGKRYYWIKLKESFMTSDVVDFMMSQKDGANYVVLYQMLCLKTINTDGRLSRQIGEIIIPYDVEKIQRDCKWFSADTIRVALELYTRFGLVYRDEDGTLVMADHGNLVGSETDYAEKNRRIRANQQKCLSDSGHNVSDDVSENVSTDIRDKSIEDRDIEIRDKSTDRKSKKKVVVESNLYDRELRRVVVEYNQQIGEIPNGSAFELFNSYYDDLGPDAMIEAIKHVNQQQPDNPWLYLKRVLECFVDAGVHDADTAKAQINDHIRKLNNRKKYNSSVPDRNQYDTRPQPEGNPFADVQDTDELPNPWANEGNT